MRCPGCGLRVTAPVPAEARGTPFGPRLHAVALYLKTFQALSYERLQGALRDLFGLRLSRGRLMNLLRRRQRRFEGGRETAISALRRAAIVASDETGAWIEGSNATLWVFRCAEERAEEAPTVANALQLDTSKNLFL